jgi:hypothetical protein
MHKSLIFSLLHDDTFFSDGQLLLSRKSNILPKESTCQYYITRVRCKRAIV